MYGPASTNRMKNYSDLNKLSEKMISIMKKMLLMAMVSISIAAGAQEPTRWRGPAGNGSYPDEGLLKEWPEGGPEMLWHCDGLGVGFSSPVFANDRIYINGSLNNQGFVFILSEDGRIINKIGYGEEFSISYPGARSSVTVAGDLVYVLSGTGRLVCMDAGKGNIRWDRHLFTDFDGSNTTWGITETVVVDGKVLYCTPGGSKYNMVALDRFTGNLVWSSPGKGERSAYCTPLLIKLPERKILVTHTASDIICVNAADGTLLWSVRHPNTYSVHANTPIYHDGSIFCFSGYGQGGVMIGLDEHGNKKSIRWRNKMMDSRMGGAVLIDGTLYGSGDAYRSWKSLDWQTGEMGFESDQVGNGVVITADGNLYCYSQRGELVMVPADPSKFTVTGRTKISLGSGQHWAHPVIHEGRLYVRHGDVLMAYRIK